MRNCLAERADGYGIVWDIANGEDIYEVRAKTANAMRRAHEQSLPTVLEVEHVPLLRTFRCGCECKK
jgi:pyruvate dehydrogenase E1 component alpha subunit